MPAKEDGSATKASKVRKPRAAPQVHQVSDTEASSVIETDVSDTTATEATTEDTTEQDEIQVLSPIQAPASSKPLNKGKGPGKAKNAKTFRSNLPRAQSSTPATKEQSTQPGPSSSSTTDKPNVARAKEVQQLKHVLKSSDPSKTLQNAMKLIPSMLETAKTQIQGTSSQTSQVM